MHGDALFKIKGDLTHTGRNLLRYNHFHGHYSQARNGLEGMICSRIFSQDKNQKLQQKGSFFDFVRSHFEGLGFVAM